MQLILKLFKKIKVRIHKVGMNTDSSSYFLSLNLCSFAFGIEFFRVKFIPLLSKNTLVNKYISISIMASGSGALGFHILFQALSRDMHVSWFDKRSPYISTQHCFLVSVTLMPCKQAQFPWFHNIRHGICNRRSYLELEDFLQLSPRRG